MSQNCMVKEHKKPAYAFSILFWKLHCTQCKECWLTLKKQILNGLVDDYDAFVDEPCNHSIFFNNRK